MSFDNPFRESRLNDSRNFRPEWDVPELNQGITGTLAEEVNRLRGRKEADPGQMILVMTGPPGYGKTHLFGRIEHLLGQEVFFVFVPAFEPGVAPIDHVRWHVVEALFRVPEGSCSPVEMALAWICRPAFADYFVNLPSTLAATHQTLYRRLDESPEAVLEIIRQLKNLGPFLKLTDSFPQVLPDAHAGIVRALALGWAPAPWSSTARRWLQGQDLPDADRETLGLGEDGPSALDVLRAMPSLFGYHRPMIICCDQIEGLLQGEGSDPINLFSTSMMDLLQAVPVQLVISIFHDKVEKFQKTAFNAFKTRMRQPFFKLEALKPEHAIGLVRARMASWGRRKAEDPPAWPFNETSISRLVRENGPNPRALIQLCDLKFSDWIAEGGNGEIDLTRVGPGPDMETSLLQEWARELEEIRKTPERSASYVQEERLYRGILEALKLAHSAQRLHPFGGVRILDVRDNAVKATPPAKRPGALVTIATGPGKPSRTVLLALTKVEASKSLGAYFKAIQAASAGAVAGAIVIHPKRDLVLGERTQELVDGAKKVGRLRMMPLEDYPMTYQATECLVALLERAEQRMLVFDNVTLSPDDCRDLVIKTGLIDNLDLFKMLGGWKQPEIPPGTTAADSLPRIERISTPTPEVATPVPPSFPVSVDAPKAIDQDGWAEKMLAAAVKKLRLLGQGVDPDGVEVGPTFARLRVRPVGKTNFKGVSNKAVDIRISLGLEVVPIVGSQAGCISIDIQRPERTVVSFAAALANAPQSVSGMPAFPVGQDVAGQGHWLNLADPTDCHLLVAGTTGSGKSEFLRAAIGALAARLKPDQIQFILIDPKRVTFNLCGNSPYLRSPIAYNVDDALPIIQACRTEMERRYELLQERKLSNVSELPPDLLPRIVLLIDEFASFLEDKESKKIVNDLLKRIGAMARAAGIHLIVSTQRPDKDVITPLLRENLPGRIALRVSSKAGSDLILDSPDAEHLLGRGDLFWKSRGELLRLQSPLITQSELERALQCGV